MKALPLPRVLAIAAPDPEPAYRGALHWFRLFMLMHMAARTLLTLQTGAAQGTLEGAVMVVVVVCGLLGFVPRVTLQMTRVVAGLVAVQIVLTLPMTANHLFAEWLCLALLALLDESDDGERALLLRGLRWFTVIFFFWTGVQKVLYGTYFDGQFLGHAVATQDRFAEVFRWMLPAEEYERLRALGAAQPGAGPYSVRSPLFLVVSNAVWVFELIAPVLMLVPRTRTVAALASMVFIAAVEAGAREFVFGALMVNLLVLFVPPGWTQRIFPLCAALYLYLVLMGFGAVPRFFHSV